MRKSGLQSSCSVVAAERGEPFERLDLLERLKLLELDLVVEPPNAVARSDLPAARQAGAFELFERLERLEP